MIPRAVALAALLLLAACSGGDAAGLDPCSLRQGTEVPAGCEPQAVPTAAPPGAPAPPADEGSAAYDALVVAAGPGDLARGGNDADAALTTLSLPVVLPRGTRLRSRVVCEGTTVLVLRTVPESGAASALDCGAGGVPAELVVEDQVPAATDTAYEVVVTAPAPSRWYAVVSAVPPS